MCDHPPTSHTDRTNKFWRNLGSPHWEVENSFQMLNTKFILEAKVDST